MNDQQLGRTLKSVGKECFVTYFREFSNPSLSNEDIAEILMQDRRYTDDSCRSRPGHARGIIRAGRAKDALIDISVSRVPPEIRRRAGELAATL